MRHIMSALAAVLSLAMVSTSASALVCDLSCSLGRMHSDCTMAVQAGGDVQAMANASSKMKMAGMDMPGMKMASEDAEEAAQPGTGENVRGHSSAAPKCMHSLWSQTLVSASGVFASRSTGNRSQASRLAVTGEWVARPFATAIHSRDMKFEVSPPKAYTADRPSTTLRI